MIALIFKTLPWWLLQRLQDLVHICAEIIIAAALKTLGSNTTSYIMNSQKAHRDLNNQSIEIPGTGGARQSPLVPLGQVSSMEYEDAKNLLEVMERGCRLSNNGPCLGWRSDKPEYKWLRYEEVIQRSKNIGSGLISLGLKPGQSTYIGIYAKNCVEWVLVDYACYHQSLVNVPLYDTLGPHACSYVINQTELSIVFCDTEERVKTLLCTAKDTASLKYIIVSINISEGTKKMAEDNNVKLYLLKDIEMIGKEKPQPLVVPTSNDVCTICYTSGTTKNPKGVILTHANMISVACSTTLQLGDYAPKLNDVYASFLPLAHMMERSVLACYFLNGACCGFFRGDIKNLMDDLKVLQPTMIASVPRLLNRIHDKVEEDVSNSHFKKLVLNFAVKRKMEQIKKCIIRNDTIWDKLVFNKVSEALGGKLRLVMSGGAPLSEKVLNFTRCALGCMVLEGYGQTETGAACAVGTPWDLTPGQVGPPAPCCHVKLVDVPEMEYFASKGQGEICVKGSSVFKGYFKLPEETIEAMDCDGWLHTGDIGVWLPNGTLKIVDRKKHIFKLSQGEYIAPEKIENVYIGSKFVSQVFVYGQSLWSSLVGIVVPDEIVLKNWCEMHNISGNWKEICNEEVVKKAIYDDMVNSGKKTGLKSFEQVKDIYVHPEPFTLDNGFLTPTSKIKRTICQKYFNERLQKMYKKITKNS